MAEGSPAKASRESVDGKRGDGNVVSSAEIDRSQLPDDAGPPREHQEQPEYDNETVERVYRKLDLRIIPGEFRPLGTPTGIAASF